MFRLWNHLMASSPQRKIQNQEMWSLGPGTGSCRLVTEMDDGRSEDYIEGGVQEQKRGQYDQPLPGGVVANPRERERENRYSFHANSNEPSPVGREMNSQSLRASVREPIITQIGNNQTQNHR